MQSLEVLDARPPVHAPGQDGSEHAVLTGGSLDQSRQGERQGERGLLSRLDDIHIQYVEGHAELARKRLAEEIYDRQDDDGIAMEPPGRTRTIVAQSGLANERRRQKRTSA